jgi:hypothetical protein
MFSLAFSALPPLQAASIYFCTTNDGTHPGAIYKAGAGEENYSLVAAIPGCGNGVSPNAGPAGSIAIDGQGSVFQSDSATGSIYRITADGNVSTFASGLTGDGSLNLAFDGTGDLFVAAPSLNTIYEYSPGGAQSTFYSGPAANSPGFGNTLAPGALAVDANGNVFVAVGDGCIDEISPGGAIGNFSCIGEQEGSGFSDLVFANGALYGDLGQAPGGLYEFASNGNASLILSGYQGPFTIDGTGRLYFASGQLEIDAIAAGGGQSTPFSTRIFPDLGPIVADDATTGTPEPNTLVLLLGAPVFPAGARRRIPAKSGSRP